MSGTSNTLLRIIKLGVLVFVLVLGGIGITAWLAGDPEPLPFEYEGFD